MSQHPENAARRQHERWKEEIARRYPKGRFVAVEGDQIVADGETHQEVVEQLAALGKSPRGLLIVQAGVDYPDEATIFAVIEPAP